MGGGISVMASKGFNAFTLDLPPASPTSPAAPELAEAGT